MVAIVTKFEGESADACNAFSDDVCLQYGMITKFLQVQAEGKLSRDQLPVGVKDTGTSAKLLAPAESKSRLPSQ